MIEYQKLRELREIVHDVNEPITNRLAASGRYDALLEAAATEGWAHFKNLLKDSHMPVSQA